MKTSNYKMKYLLMVINSLFVINYPLNHILNKNLFNMHKHYTKKLTLMNYQIFGI